jgi:tRNA pseudouridine55 synthase
MNGLLNIHKPTGPTSHDVVARARRLLQTRRIGHAGTLDPLASGVLLLGLGTATRLLEYLADLPKRYEAVAEFGVVTSTQDLTGEVIATRAATALRREDVEDALARFRGEILQTPPMVSAVKHEGRRLYELAREGRDVERTARPVTVYAAELVGFTAGERPRAHLHVLCSSGTYVRTLIHDLGAALGPGAALASLVRTAIGPFTLADAVTLEELAALAETGEAQRRLVPPAEMIAHLPAVQVDEAVIPKLLHGGDVPAANTDAAAPAEGPVRILAPGGELLAIARWEAQGDEGRLVPVKVFMRADEAS